MYFILGISAIVSLMIFLNALYVGAEFATVGSRRTRIQQMAANGNKSAQKLLPYLTDHKKLDDYVATCQVGITISSLALAIVGEKLVAPLLPFNTGDDVSPISTIIVLALFTVLQVIMGELFPKSIAVQFPEKLALAVLTPIRWSQFVLRPIIWVCNGTAKLLLRLMGREYKDGHGHIFAPEEIEILVSESHEGGLLEDDERQYLRNAFRLRDLNAKQVMVHRTKLVAADIDTSASALLALALKVGYTRIPVYRENIDNIVGFIHIKDAFRLQVAGDEDIKPVVRKLLEVPETLPALELWERLNRERHYIAIVFDEHGSTTGMISLEDLIEEIFGELQDEFDHENALMRRNADGRLHLRGDLLVSDVNEYLELALPEDDADTIGGLVFMSLGRRPEVGDETVINNMKLRVERMDDVRVAEVSLPEQKDINLSQISEWHEKNGEPRMNVDIDNNDDASEVTK